MGQPGAGPTYVLTAGAPGPAGFSMNAALTIEGDVTAIGNVDGALVSSAGFPVATINWVNDKLSFWATSTVLGFNGRVGQVELTTGDILLAGGVSAVDARMQGTCANR